MDELRTSFENKQISRATYFRKKKALREGKCNKRKEGSGRPRKLKGKLMQKLCSIALRNPYISAQNMANRLKSENDIDIHKRTIQRNLKKSGIKKDVPKKTLDLTEEHKRKRVAFAENWKLYQFDDVWITDESMIQLHRNKVSMWYSRNGKRPTVKVPKFPKKVMVWGALSTRGFYLKIIDGVATIDSPKYCNILTEFLPYASALYPNGFIIQQDGARPHTSKYSKNWMSENSVQIMQWPPNSADLSPIENLWAILKDYIETKNPKNIEELKEKILESQHVVTLQMRLNLMRSISKRLARVILENGNQIK